MSTELQRDKDMASRTYRDFRISSKLGLCHDEEKRWKEVKDLMDKAFPPYEPPVDLSIILVTICIRTGTPLDLQRLWSVPDITTTMNHVTNHTALFELIASTHEIVDPLSSIYGLDLSSHQESLFRFTDEKGLRHTVPLYRYEDPTLLGDADGAGALLSAWKDKVIAGTLYPEPECFCQTKLCCGARHSVEVIEVLQTEDLVDQCNELYTRLADVEVECKKQDKKIKKLTQNEEKNKARVARAKSKLKWYKKENKRLKTGAVQTWLNCNGDSGERAVEQDNTDEQLKSEEDTSDEEDSPAEEDNTTEDDSLNQANLDITESDDAGYYDESDDPESNMTIVQVINYGPKNPSARSARLTRNERGRYYHWQGGRC